MSCFGCEIRFPCGGLFEWCDLVGEIGVGRFVGYKVLCSDVLCFGGWKLGLGRGVGMGIAFIH